MQKQNTTFHIIMKGNIIQINYVIRTVIFRIHFGLFTYTIFDTLVFNKNDTFIKCESQ